MSHVLEYVFSGSAHVDGQMVTSPHSQSGLLQLYNKEYSTVNCTVKTEAVDFRSWRHLIKPVIGNENLSSS